MQIHPLDKSPRRSVCARLLLGMAVGAALITCSALGQVLVADNYNVTGNGTGFALGTGVNTGIQPPATRLTGSSAASLRYINTGAKEPGVYTISGNRLTVGAATNAGRFVLSADGINPFNFAPALGTASATAAQPVVYDLALRINNNAPGNQRCSLALGTADGDVDTWAFGFQIYRASGSDNFYTLGKRVDTAASGLASDLNEPITTLTGNTFGNDLLVLIRVTDAGAESSAYHSRVQVSLNGGNSWVYDTEKDSDLVNGWRLNGSGRHIMWHIAANAGPVTFDTFSLRLNPPASNLNTSSTFKVMTYNIHFGAHGGKVNTQNTANYILDQRLDLVGLNEVDRFRDRSNNRDLIAELAVQTGMHYAYSNNAVDLLGNDEIGNGILSKYPIVFRDHRLLPRLGDHEQRGLLKTVVDVNGKFLAFWSTHLDFHNDETERLLCVTELNTWVAQENLPVIVCGDFNDTPGQTFHERMEQKWDDVWLLAGDGTAGRTVPCPGPAAARIDYIWKNKTPYLTPRSAFVPNIEYSDHYPVQSQFVFSDFGQFEPGFAFSFDEGSGTRTIDLVAGLSGNLGTGAPVWSTDSPSGVEGDGSLYFDGTRKLTVPDPKQLIGTNGVNGDYTLQTWVKVPVNYAPAQRAILFQYERRPGFSLSINTNRTLHTTTFRVKDVPSTAALPNDGRWHHVAVVHTDGSSLKFYVDGVLSATVPYVNGVGLRTSSVITMGAAADDANRFTGFLDRVKFDHRALSVAELDYPAGGNIPPVASNQWVTVSGDEPAPLTLRASDANGDPVRFQIQAWPLNGLLTSFDTTNGVVTYLPARGFRGTDRLLFVANDGKASSAPATLNLSVLAPPDTDGDGLADAWEIFYGVTEPGADADGDGQSNLAEYRANTIPTNAASVFRVVTSEWVGDGSFALTWASIGGTRYRVQCADSFGPAAGTFLDVLRPISVEMDASPAGEASTQTYIDAVAGTSPGSERYYRIQVVP